MGRARVAAHAAAAAPEEIERHGLSIFGDLKYPADFRHFDYVDPNAPKGGMFSQIGPSGMYNQNLLTFNSLNAFILKGDAAQGMELTFTTLMARALDEPDAVYGLAARGRSRLTGQLDLHIPAAAGSALSRRQHFDGT